MVRLNQSRRQNVGYVHKPQVNNNIGEVQCERNMAVVQEQAFDYNMEGDGFGDIVRGIFNKGKQGLKYLWDHKKDIAQGAEKAYTSEVGTAIRNALPDSDDTARPGFAGEKHAILQLKNGKNGVANYMGPGTNVVARVRRGDMGRTPADQVAKRHDIDYALAQGQPTRAKQLGAVREADNRMIRSLKGIQAGKHGGDANRNIQMGMRLIQAKTLGEDLGVLDKSKFAGDLHKINDKDKVLLMSNRARLTQEGYGMLPGDQLKQKLLRKMVNEKKKNKLIHTAQGSGLTLPGGKYNGQSYGKTLPGMKAYKLKGMGGKGCCVGRGLTLPGGMMMGQGDVMGFILKGIVPNLVKSLGINPRALPIAKIAPIVSKALSLAKSGNLSSIISNLTKTLLPLLAHGKLKTMGVKMSGKGLMDALKGAYRGLNIKLADGLLKAFKWYLNKSAKSQGNTAPFKGSGLTLPGGSWGSFWKGFKKGFVSVFKPGAQILGTVASALGQPEFGIPLQAVSGML